MRINIEGGYILVSKKIVESEIWDKPPLYLKIWLYLLVKAQYKPYKNLDRGQTVVTIPELIEVGSYKVGYRTEKPSKTQIFNILEWLRNSHEGSHEDDMSKTMIETTKTTRGLVVNICNYNVYQDPKNYERNDEYGNEEFMNGTMLERQADTINKNLKKDKENKNKERDISADGAASSPSLIVKEIINYLNKKTGKRFSHKSEANSKLINARLREGRTLDDFKHVIDVKCDEWLNDEEMDKYLRPATLFSKNNFENYVNQNLKGQKRARVLTNDEAKKKALRKWCDSGRDPEEFDEHWHYSKQRFKTNKEIQEEKLKVESLSKQFEQQLKEQSTNNLPH